jgi:hypothetical protein
MIMIGFLNASSAMRPNKALQTDKVKLSRLLHSQEPRQLPGAAELRRSMGLSHPRSLILRLVSL